MVIPGEPILMGDVIKSRSFEAAQLRIELSELVTSCNEYLKDHIQSPYTITLGDEFQGIAATPKAMVQSVFYFEESRLRMALRFRMRFVGLIGQVNTPIDGTRAHGMMGPGLTRARELLTKKRRGQGRFLFDFGEPSMTWKVNKLFSVVAGLTARWRIEDGELIHSMLSNTDNSEVGERHKKNRSQIWKRRRSLLIEEYRSLKEVVLQLAESI